LINIFQFCLILSLQDQFVSSAGCEEKLLLIDCRSLDFREVAMGESDGGKPVLVVTNSNVQHNLGDSEYPVRVQQCKDATAALSKLDCKIQTLRDATVDEIDVATSQGLLGGILLQRSRHVVGENKRTEDTATALEKGDWISVGNLINSSHASMRDDYEVSCKEIDILVDLAQSFEGVYGSRLTGGGFGGCTVTLVRENVSRALMDYLKEQYKEKTGLDCVCFKTCPSDGARVL
jgi:galactokinase